MYSPDSPDDAPDDARDDDKVALLHRRNVGNGARVCAAAYILLKVLETLLTVTVLMLRISEKHTSELLAVTS
jgi:hypothetical protein